MSDDLDDVRQRVAAATPGPWLTPEEAGDPYAVNVIDHEGCDVWPWSRQEDMEFAYKARTDVPRLFARIAELEKNVQESHMVISAAALSAGGFLRIARKAMTEIDLDGELSAWSEPDSIVYTYHPRSQEADL